MHKVVANGLSLAVIIIVGVVAVTAPEARACSIAEVFEITPAHLQAKGFNQSDSLLATEYREWTRDDDAVLHVRGAYVHETIYTVEAEGDWSRGSVSVPVELWGDWPDDMTADLIASEDRSGTPPDTCGWGKTGRTTGTREYFLLTTDGVYPFGRSDDVVEVLNSAFGAPAIAERDADFESQLIAQLEASRKSSTLLFGLAGLGALVVAAVVLYLTRGRKPASEDIDSF